MRQERDNAALMLQDQKKQKIYDLEDITIMEMQNNELKKRIQKMETETAQLKAKRVTTGMHLETVLEELFKINEGYKLYNQSLEQLTQANHGELNYILDVKAQIKELRKLLQEEQAERDELKQLCILQRKKINANRQTHEKESIYLQRGLTQMNETIQNNTDLSLKVMKQLERNSKNLVAKQSSQFFNSKYQKSKLLGSIYTNKSRFELNMSTLKDNVNKQISDSLSQKPQYGNSIMPKRSFSAVKSDIYGRNGDEDDNDSQLFARHTEVKEEDEVDKEEDSVE